MYSKQTKLNVYWKLISNLVPLGSIIFEMETLNKSVPKLFFDKKLRHDYPSIPANSYGTVRNSSSAFDEN